MTELLTAAQMRAIEAAEIASGAVTGLELMERAGRGVVQAMFEEWPELAPGAERKTGALPAAGRSRTDGDLPAAPGYLDQGKGALHRAVVLCGPGNNGGDGFVVARLLREHGWGVSVFLYGEPKRMPEDAKVNHDRWRRFGDVRSLDRLLEEPLRADVIVDALFGAGLTRPLDPEVCGLVSEGRRAFACERVVAVDAPSGLCLDSGRRLGAAIPADLTVTFHRRKLGHVLAEGPEVCSKVVVKEIGIEAGPDPAPDAVRLVAPEPGVALKSKGHKYTHGHALVLSGTSGRAGAARLAARGALRIGAGLVTVGSPPEALGENAARLDAVMLREMDGAGAMASVLKDRRINALCLGPGLGTDARQAELIAVALGNRVDTRLTVLDADALTLLAREPNLFAALHADCVLTPHAGEFERLFPDLAEALAAPATKGPAYSKVDATRQAAARAGCVVLFKGPDTVIAGPDGSCAINSASYERAAPWLATAGSGDVLAGFITGLMARGFSAFDAARVGASLHVDCALSFGPGLIAEDLPEELPRVLRSLLQ